MKRLLILTLCMAFVNCSLAAKETRCHNGGEYCLNHWDCCSNTCLSFLYQCSNIPSTDLQPSQNIPSSSSFGSVSSQGFALSSSLGSSSSQGIPSSSFGSAPSQGIPSSSLDSRFEVNPIASSSPAYLAEDVPPSSPDTVSYEALLEIIFKPLRFVPAISTENEEVSIKQRFGDEAKVIEDEVKTAEKTSTTTEKASNAMEIKSDFDDSTNQAESKTKEEIERTASSTRASQMCKEIGSKCYTNEECCTKRCHGFLHQCVT